MKHKYYDYEKRVILLKGVADIHSYELILPDAPEPEQIVNYGQAPKDQYFQREVLPFELKKIDFMVKSGRITREQGLQMIEADPKLSAYVEGLWRKRTGEDLVFQYINGRPLHIPPEYWMYLNFWEIPKVKHNRPEFRVDFYHYSTDLWLFSWWRYLVKPSPYCAGAIMFTQRQVGKSYIGMLLGYEAVSFEYEAHAGLQSKDDKTAAMTFNTRLVRPWRQLPFFFQPKGSNSSMPGASGLQFTPPPDRSKNPTLNVSADEEEYIMGSFTYGPSNTDHYDGYTLDYYFADEPGKTVTVSVVDRWATVKESLKRRGGKAFWATTVEELEKKGGANFFSVWDDSDRSPIQRGQKQVTVDANGETNSGLWPWFTSAYCNEAFDEYGIAIVDTITARQIEYRKLVAKTSPVKTYPTMCGIESVDFQINREKDQQKRQAIIRKKPRNIKEARSSSTNFCHYNRLILDTRIQHFVNGYTNEELPTSIFSINEIQNEVLGLTAQQKAEWNYSPGVRWGKFEWIDPSKPYKCGVYFQPTAYDDARFHVNHLLDPAMRNKFTIVNNKWKPANTAKIRSGADPFKYNTPDVKNKNKMSDGAQHVYMFHDSKIDFGKPREKWVTQNFIYEYLYRGDSMPKEELFEDWAKACIYFGCKLYPERNYDEVLDHFKRKGMEYYIHLGVKIAAKGDFIGYKQESVGGDITGDMTIQKMHRHNADFVNNDAVACVFHRTILQLREVEDDFGPYDLAVSCAYTLMASFEADVANKANDLQTSVSRDDIMELTGGFYPS